MLGDPERVSVMARASCLPRRWGVVFRESTSGMPTYRAWMLRQLRNMARVGV